MKFGKLAGALAAVSLVAAPVMAQSAPAVERVSAKTDATEKMEGDSRVIFALLAAAAIIAGVIITADNDDDNPTSP